MKQNRFPVGWNETRVRKLIEHYEGQTDDEAIAEDEASFKLRGHAVMVVPKRLVPEITRFIERQPASRPGGSGGSSKGPQRRFR